MARPGRKQREIDGLGEFLVCADSSSLIPPHPANLICRLFVCIQANLPRADAAKRTNDQISFRDSSLTDLHRLLGYDRAG